VLEGIHFSYDGIKSTDLGLFNVKLDGGMFEEAFLPDREIKEVKVAGKGTPYFQRVEKSPLEFDLSFAFEFDYDEEKIRRVARLFDQDFYKPFYTVSNNNRIFYCMPIGDSTLTHTGAGQGYFSIRMRCDSPYSYSKQQVIDNMYFDNTRFVKNYLSTANDLDITKFDTLTLDNGTLKIDMANVNWSMLNGMKWSDFD